MHVIESVLANQTVTSSGSYVFRAGSNPEVVLIYNISGPFGTSGLTFQLVEVDPADETTPVGQPVFSTLIDVAGTGTLGLRLTKSSTVKVIYDLVGTSVAGATASIYAQASPLIGTVSLSSAEGVSIDVPSRNNSAAVAIESRPLEMLLNSILEELRLVRRHIETITDEDDPL